MGFEKKFFLSISQKPETMNFGLDIFPEAIAEVYVVWKRDDIETQIVDDINRKRKPEVPSFSPTLGRI